jgi:hypothetical protein
MNFPGYPAKGSLYALTAMIKPGKANPGLGEEALLLLNVFTEKRRLAGRKRIWSDA